MITIYIAYDVMGQFIAYDDNYDADCDEDGFYSDSPTGSGTTKNEAIENLLDYFYENESYSDNELLETYKHYQINPWFVKKEN